MGRYTISDTQSYYDLMAPFYHRFWGTHLHWGLFNNGEDLDRAAKSATRYFISRLPLTNTSLVCDLACGAGGPTDYIRRELGCDCIGIDISPIQLQLAQEYHQEKDPASGGRIHLVRADAHALPLSDESVDALCCFSAFYHFHDKGRVADEVLRAVKRGGYFFFDDLVETGALEPQERAEIFERQCITSLGTPEFYLSLLAERGFVLLGHEDLTRHFIRTYETAIARLTEAVDSCGDLPEARRKKLPLGFQRLLRAAREGRVGWHAFWCRKQD